MKSKINKTTLYIIFFILIFFILISIFLSKSNNNKKNKNTNNDIKTDSLTKEQYSQKPTDINKKIIKKKLGFIKLEGYGISFNQRVFIGEKLEEYFFTKKDITLIRLDEKSIKLSNPLDPGAPFIIFKVFLDKDDDYYYIKLTKNQLLYNKPDVLEVKDKNNKLLKKFER